MGRGNSILDRVVARDGIDCWLCGLPTTKADRSRDCLVPQKDGGTHSTANVRLAHKLCNSVRGHMPAELAPAYVRMWLDARRARDARRRGEQARRATKQRKPAQAPADLRRGLAERGGLWIDSDPPDYAG